MIRRSLWRPSGWRRITWGCEGEGLAWWAGWWPNVPALWSGTGPGIGEGTCSAALARWGFPGGGTQTHCSGSPSSCCFSLFGKWREMENALNLEVLRITFTTCHMVSQSDCVSVQTGLTALHSHTNASSSIVRTMQCDLSEHWHSHVEKVHDFNQTLLGK